VPSSVCNPVHPDHLRCMPGGGGMGRPCK
jgi:hypothetical protein